jgi:hypothetical protein
VRQNGRRRSKRSSNVSGEKLKGNKEYFNGNAIKQNEIKQR